MRGAGRRGLRALSVGVVLPLSAVAGAGIGGASLFACNDLIGLGDFTVGPDDASAGGDGCVAPTGFGGRGCYRCAPTTSDELLSACTTSHFEAFDNRARISGFSPDDPPPDLPPVDAGDAGSSDSGSDASDGGDDGGNDGGSDAGGNDGGPTLPECLGLGLPNPVLVAGATGFPFEVTSQAVGDEATIFYKETGSCLGVDAIFTGGTKMSGAAVYFQDGTAKQCTFSTPRPADIGPSALFADTCTNPAFPTVPPDVGDFLGPVSPVMLVVPATSSQRAISAEAAYRVYGLGAQSKVEPWTDRDFIFRRNVNSANQNAVALTLRLPVDRFLGIDSGGSSRMRQVIQNSTAPEKTIGISSSEIVDPARAVMRALAFQHFKQPVGFYPDSDPAAYDKKNVRDGHYYVWVSLHLFAHLRGGEIIGANPDLESGGAPLRSADAVKNLVLYMTNRKAFPRRAVDVFAAYKATGLVPQCAMHVTRQREGAPLQPFTPAIRCDCAFESAPPGATLAQCKPCQQSSECSGDRPTCTFGYCE